MRKRALYIVMPFALGVLLAGVSCGKKNGEDEAARQAARKNIVETGELAAVNSKSFVMPRYGRNWYMMRVIGILEHGALVSPGDSIIQLDPSDIRKFIVDRETSLETQLAALEKLQVDQANSENAADSRIRSELATFELKKIELESSRFESERYRKIKALEFRQAEITLAKEKRKMELAGIINENNLKIQRIRVRQIENDINYAKDLIPALTIRTPIEGVFQIAHNYRTGALVKVSDEIYTGNNLANVPELKWMKVNTYISEQDFLKIHNGQKVAVRLDALPNVVFDAEIAYIGKLCHRKDEKSRQKVFDVEVHIAKSDERLKPGMTVSCEYLTD